MAKLYETLVPVSTASPEDVSLLTSSVEPILYDSEVDEDIPVVEQD